MIHVAIMNRSTVISDTDAEKAVAALQIQVSKDFAYIGVYLVGQGWTQITAEKNNMRARPPVGSRRERRTIMASKLILSTAD